MYCTLGKRAVYSKGFFLVMKILFLNGARFFSVPSHHSVFIMPFGGIFDTRVKIFIKECRYKEK